MDFFCYRFSKAFLGSKNDWLQHYMFSFPKLLLVILFLFFTFFPSFLHDKSIFWELKFKLQVQNRKASSLALRHCLIYTYECILQWEFFLPYFLSSLSTLRCQICTYQILQSNFWIFIEDMISTIFFVETLHVYFKKIWNQKK